MLAPQRIEAALTEKREEFRHNLEHDVSAVQMYESLLARLDGTTSQEIESELGGIEWPGARPTGEIDRGGLIVPFGRTWESWEEAREWALEKLSGVTTVGVDGSQIAPSKEFAVPVSLVQVAWFENPHDPDRPYVKDVLNEILLPDGVEIDAGEHGAEARLNLCRFRMEMKAARDRIELLTSEPVPLVFVDGSMVLSFAGRMAPDAREAYISALLTVLDASERRRVPVVGYIDRSFASDLCGMLRSMFETSAAPPFDARVLSERMDVFDRTAAFVCARGDILPRYRTEQRDRFRDICFVYLKVGSERVPSRIEFPRWILDAGLLDHVVDVVRAEILVAGGYPYALEAADATAVLTREDRVQFYRLFQDFSEREGLISTLPGKSVSKAHRR